MIPISEIMPSMPVIPTSCPMISTPVAAPNSENNNDSMITNDMRMSLKWNSNMAKMIMIEMAKPLYICGSVSRSFSLCPPTLMVTPCGSSIFFTSSITLSVTLLRFSPRLASAITDIERTPLRWWMEV